MIRHPHGLPRSTTHRLRSARRRALLLAVVWVLSGLWSVGHALAHEAEHAPQHTAMELHRGGISMAASHGHGHAHPEFLPVVATGKVPGLETFALLTDSPEVACDTAALRWFTRTYLAVTNLRLTTASGPRAPPAS